MSKSTPRKRTARATGATSSTGTRTRIAARSPASKTMARRQTASTKKSLAAAGEPKATRKPPEPNEETLTVADYSAEVQAAVRAASAKKAERIMVLDLRHTSAFTDVFVLCTGQNARQVKAIVDSVDETLRTAHGQKAVAIEGYRNSEWVLVDYFDFVVHVFTPESREFYALERLWGSAIRVEVGDEAAARPA
jgi:ribosome-associated protein